MSEQVHQTGETDKDSVDGEISSEHMAASLLADVLKHGDVLDADSRLKDGVLSRNRGSRSFIIGQSLAGASEGLAGFALVTEAANTVVGYPAAAAAGTAISTAGYALNHRLQLKRAAKREDSQQTIREQLQEPVDIVRIGKRKHRELVARWYAPDAVGEGQKLPDEVKYSLVSRLHELTQNVDQTAVRKLAFGTEWLKQSGLDEKVWREHGEVVPGRSYFKDAKKVKVADEAANDELLVVSVEQAAQLAQKLQESLGSDISSRLVDIIHSSNTRTNVPTLFKQYQQAPNEQSRRQLIRALSTEIAATHDQDAMMVKSRKQTTRRVPVPTEEGQADQAEQEEHGQSSEEGQEDQKQNQAYTMVGTTSIITSKAASTSTVQGDTLLSTVQPLAHQGTREVHNHRLLGLARADNLHELTAQLLPDSEQPQGHVRLQEKAFEARIALLLRLRQQSADETDGQDQTQTSQTAVKILPRDQPPTVFTQVVQEKPRAMPLLRKQGKQRTAPDSSRPITYEQRRSKPRRAFLALGATALTMAGFAGANTAAEAGLNSPLNNARFEANEDYYETHPYLDEGIIDDSYWERYRETEHGPWGAALRAHDEYSQLAYNVYEASEQQAVNMGALGLLRLIDPSSSIGYQVRGNLEIEPQEMLNGYLDGSYGNQPRYADALPGKLDIQAFTITSPTGQPTPAYLYTDTFDTLVKGSGFETLMPPLQSGSYAMDQTVLRSYQEPVVLPIEAPADQTVLYEIETPYVFDSNGYLTNLQLPYAAGSRIGAAYITDIDPDSPYYGKKLDVSVDNLFGSNYLYDMDSSSLDDRQITGFFKPALRYFLIEDKDNIPKATQPVKSNIFAPPDDLVSYPIPPSVSNRVKAALELPASASDAMVVKALQDKIYSYRPYQDNGVKPGSITPKDDQEGVALTAEYAAGMKALNCTIADYVAIIALGGQYEGKPINQAIGWKDSNGDGKIIQAEAHGWLYDDEGEIIDPTPQNSPPADIKPNDSLRTELEDGSLVDHLQTAAWLLGAGAIVGLGYRRRGKLQAAMRNIQDRRAETLISEPHPEYVQRGLSIVRHELWSEFAPVGNTAKNYRHEEQTPPARRVQDMHLPEGVRSKVAKKILINPEYSSADKAAALRVLQALPAMKRVVNRLASN